MTLAEKILSAHCGKPAQAGDIVVCDIDFMLLHDAAGPLALKAFESLGGKKVKDPSRMAIVLDHCAPAPTEKIANYQKSLRDFAFAQGTHFFESGEGICHQLLIENGLVKAGDLVLGTDSHTCTYGAVGAFSTGVGATDLMASAISGKNWFKVPETIKVDFEGDLGEYCTSKDLVLTVIGMIGAAAGNYKAFEFYGEYLEQCPLADRMTISNMIVEMGGKAGFLCSRKLGIAADEGASYSRTVALDLGRVVPSVAKPHTVDNWAPVSEVAGIPFQYGYLGTCVNGRLEDLRLAAKILRGKKLAKGVRLVIVPASRRIMLQAAEEGILRDLCEAGGSVFTPGCAACVGTHGGIPADGEVVISTANRNFKGRMGNNKAEIYLASPATVAASCLTGVITDPRTIGRS
jgi:3-isopropylmalate/(R)-2-methylmalate dehydratase large subunit